MAPQRGGWDVFSRVVIYLKNTPTSHAVSLALVMYTHVVILQSLFCHTFAYAITANSIWLRLLVPPLAQCCCFLLNITACTAALIGGCTVRRERKRPLQQLHSKRGVGLLRGWACFQEITVHINNKQTNKQTNKTTKHWHLFSLQHSPE